MTSIAVCFLYFVAIWIIVAQLTSAQHRQGSSRSAVQGGRTPRNFRIQARNGARIKLNRRQSLPGPRNIQQTLIKSRAQRLSNTGRGNSPRRPTISTSSRLRSLETRRRLNRPAKTTRSQPSVTRTLPILGTKQSMIYDQLKIFARNLQVIDDTTGLSRPATSVKTARSKNEAMAQRKPVPTKSTQTKRRDKMTPKNSRTTKRLPATKSKGGEKMTGSRIAPLTRNSVARSLRLPSPRSPLRIRARLRQISSKTPKAFPNERTSLSNINTRNSRGGKGSIGGGQKRNRRRDMIAIDDVISLVKAIKGDKDPNSAASRSKSSLVTPAMKNTKSITSAGNIVNNKNNIQTSNRIASSNKEVSKHHDAFTNNHGITAQTPNKQVINSEGQRQTGNPMDMLTQMALINGGESGGIFNGKLSNPAFLKQMSAGNDGILLQLLTGSRNQLRGNEGHNLMADQSISLNAIPSILQGLSDIKTTLTGNPIQEQTMSSLMNLAIRHLREDLRENIGKRMNDGDSPSSRSKLSPSTSEQK